MHIAFKFKFSVSKVITSPSSWTFSKVAHTHTLADAHTSHTHTYMHTDTPPLA